METILTILIITTLGLIIYMIYLNQRTLRKIVNYKRSDKEIKISDERYYELNNRIQLLIVVSSIIILIGGFVGYNSIGSIKKEISDDIEHYKTNLQHYDENLKHSDSAILKYQLIIDSLEMKQTIIIDSLDNLTQDANELKTALLKLQNDYRLSSKTYFVTGIEVKPYVKGEKDETHQRLYFKDLKTSSGKKLPNFKTEPYINIMGKGIGWVIIQKITTKYFEYGIMRVVAIDEKTGKEIDEQNPEVLKSFDLLIIEGIDYGH